MKNSPTVLKLAPGLGLSAVVALLATLVNTWVSLLSAMLVAILVGLLLRNTGLVPAVAEPGLKVSGKTVLRAGVVLLGLRLSIPEVLKLGVGAVVVLAVTVTSVFLVTLGMGRVMRVPHTTALLTATGTAICGAAAVAGMSAVVRPDKKGDDDVEDAAATAIASVTLFGTVAILVLPLLVRLLGLGTTGAGVWVGASVHEVGQVVAAAGLINDHVLDVAVVAKLGRVVLLAPLVVVVGAVEGWRARRDERQRIEHGEVEAVLHDVSVPHEVGRTSVVPLFVVGFLMMAIIRSVSGGHVPSGLFEGIEMVASFLLTMAMCAMGSGVNLRRLARTGLRSLALGACAGLVAAIVPLVAVLVLVRG